MPPAHPKAPNCVTALFAKDEKIERSGQSVARYKQGGDRHKNNKPNDYPESIHVAKLANAYKHRPDRIFALPQSGVTPCEIVVHEVNGEKLSV
jgi:hypothetical protein